MERRKFFLIAASGATILAIPSWYYFAQKNKKKDALFNRPQQLQHIWDKETILEVGKLYLDQNPKESKEQTLLNLVSKSISPKKTDLNEVIKKDYKVGRMVMVDGWFLSATEARQCALYYLKQTN